MQINSIQPYNINYEAKLKVIGKDFDKNLFAQLRAKANSIGLQYDVIELKYADFQDIKENTAFGRKNIIEKGMKRISDKFHGRFIPQGDEFGTDYFEMTLSADKYTDLWKLEDNIAEKYLYILGKKYNI